VTPQLSRFGRRVFVAVLIIGLIAAAAYAIDLILLILAGMLLAVLLRGAGTWLEAHSGLSIKWSMLIALVAFGVVFFGSLWLFGVHIADQADQLIAAVSQAYVEFQTTLQQYRVTDFLVSRAGTVLPGPAKAASGALWVVASMVLILFLGVYLSTSPELYTELFLNFFNGRLRKRIEKLLDGHGLGAEMVDGWTVRFNGDCGDYRHGRASPHWGTDGGPSWCSGRVVDLRTLCWSSRFSDSRRFAGVHEGYAHGALCGCYLFDRTHC